MISGNLLEIWQFNVFGMNVLDNWLGVRTSSGTGRSAGTAATSPDHIRGAGWADEWNDELLDLPARSRGQLNLAMHNETCLDGDIFESNELPQPISS